MPQLDGSPDKVPLGNGYAISAPGLRGTVTAHGGRKAGDRGDNFEEATEALDAALASAGLTELRRIELAVSGTPGGAARGGVRAPSGEPGLVLEVPDLGATVEQLVLAVDEAGVVTWNFPLDPGGRRESSVSRGAGGVKRFVIRAAPAGPAPGEPDPPEADGQRRGLFGPAGRKLLKVLVFPVTDPVLGPMGEHYARSWEGVHRPNRLRPFGPDDYTRADVPALDAGAQDRLAEGRALLFVHGTFSTTHGGFAGLPRATVAALHAAYQGRVFALDHATLSVDPAANADFFRSQLTRPLDLDIVCHSRGGLVARAIAGELSAADDPLVQVGRVVFVGASNAGTLLADPDHWVDLIDRHTTLLNLSPPGLPGAVGDSLEAILAAVKIIGHGFLTGIPGLAALRPDGDFVRRINQGREIPARYFGITSNYEPRGGLKQLVADQAMDRIFGTAHNDLVVPTLGVFQAEGSPAFPVPDTRLLQFGPGDGVDHSGYFSRPETTARLIEWLTAA